MYDVNENGERVYTLKVILLRVLGKLTNDPSCLQKHNPEGKPNQSAHPARFSPEDKFSRHRIIIKKRFGLLLTQKPEPVY